MVFTLNQMMLPNDYDEIRKKVEALVATGELDLDEVKPEFVHGMLLLDMLSRTTLVTIFCMVLWNVWT